MKFRTVKNFLLSLLFFSSIANAQVPDEVLFYNLDGFSSYSFLKIDNGLGKAPYTLSYSSLKLTWSEINDKCSGHIVNGYCELYLFRSEVNNTNSKIGLYKINLTTGEFLPFVDLGTGAAGTYIREFNYSDGLKNIKTLSHLYNSLNGWSVELPLESVNRTRVPLSFMATTKTQPPQEACSMGEWGIGPKSFPAYSYLHQLFNFNEYFTMFNFTFENTVELHGINNNQCAGPAIGSIYLKCFMYSEFRCDFSIHSVLGSGFLLSYNNRILEINYAPPALSVIPNQTITANKAYQLDMKPYLTKLVDGTPKVTMTLQPQAPAGLSFDAEAMVLKGRANATGSYRVMVNATSSLGKAAPMSFMLNIGINEDDKPEWKPMQSLPAATVDGQYDYDLNRLLAKAHGAVTITLAESFPQPEWVQVVNGHLTGTPTTNDAGSEQQVTLFAESSTGGHTRPLTVSIPVAYDARLRPVMKSFEWTLPVGFPFNFDLRDHVVDPTNDANVEIVLDRVEPASDWLAMSRHNKTMLSGTTPENVPGQEFTLTMHAHNSQGGDSEKVTSKFKIRTSSDYKPRFNGANPILPFMIPGTPYFYDFTVNHDVWPEGIPFILTFAEGYDHPTAFS